MQLQAILDSIYILPEQSKARLEAAFSEVRYPRGHVLLRPGKIETMLYFIGSGSGRAYAEQGEGETTFWFGIEGAALLSMNNYVHGRPSYEHVDLLEASLLYAIPMPELKRLFLEDLAIANWGRVFAEQELIRTEERLISRQFRTAEDRYLELLQRHPEILLRVPLRHIASYLGITPISLSRIRRKIS